MAIVGGLDSTGGRSPRTGSTLTPARPAAGSSARPPVSSCAPGWLGSLASRPTSPSKARPAGGLSPRRSWTPASAPIWPSQPTPGRCVAQAAGQDRPHRRRPPAGAAGRGPAARVLDATRHVADARTRVRLRRALVGERTGWYQRIHAILFHHGLPERSQLLTADGRAWLARVELPVVARQAVELALGMIDHPDTELALLDTELARIARVQPGCTALQRR